MSIQNKNDYRLKSNFTGISISLASPETTLERSNGEVLKPETINYRSLKPERDGLFCERIFGPTKDYECYCGKYKRIRYKGIICDRCGVEVTEKKVRRERMGHINLVIPVAHIWYFRSLPNKIGYLLGLSSKKLEMIIYYERFVVVQPGAAMDELGINYKDFLTEEEYLEILEKLPKENQYLEDSDPNKFIAKMGGEALIDLLSRVDLDDLSYSLRHQAANETSNQRKTECLKRLQVVEAFRLGNQRIENRPEWMVIKVLPIIPPDLRPLVPLDGGRFATADLNDLYRRIIIRNNRLKRLMEIKAPDVILRNEKRMLQEAVDSLLDNSRKNSAVKAEGNRALKSLSDIIKGKQGRFRQNLLGKRVDYSARSVIVVGPNLRLHECGLPKDMAAELYKPFIIRRLMDRGIVKTVKSAKKIVENKHPVVWDILENVLKGHPVLLNRAPTLHRLGVQAFQPRLVEGKAIQLHPLVCTAFNADFDGDQMAVHLPLSNAAILEAQILMLSAHNILNPANASPITVPSQDMVLGLYYTTKGRRSTKQLAVKGEGMTFYSPEEVKISYNEEVVDLHAWIKVRVPVMQKDETLKTELLETTVGRVIFNECVPEEIGFINELLTKKSLREIIGLVFDKVGMDKTSTFLDKIKDLGFEMAFKGGLSFNLGDIEVPEKKFELIDKANREVAEVMDNYNNGFITNNERYNQIIDIWTRINGQISQIVMDHITKDNQGFNSVFMMLDSGARGSKEQIRQLCAMRGLMAKPKKSGSGGEVIENPILSNFKEGLSVLEYFISSHGARKGLADTALKTADAGYLTRRLHDVAQDMVITESNCGTLRGIYTTALKDNEDIVEPLYDRILGRVALEDVYHPITNELLVSADQDITEEIAKKIEASPLEGVDIRSVLTCESKRGVCALCYGMSMITKKRVQIGEAVGVIAAQSIGEPGTQLTLRTFHVGGTASNVSSESQINAKFAGKILFENVKKTKYTPDEGDPFDVILGRMGEFKIVGDDNKVLMVGNIPYGAHLFVKDKAKIKKDQKICSWDPYNATIISEISGKVEFASIVEGITYREEIDDQTGHREKVIIESRDKTQNPTINILSGKETKTYNIPVGAHINVPDNQSIKIGQVLAKIPRIIGKTKDITGGLPRVTELLEARNPSNLAIITEIDGVVTLGGIKRGNREVVIEAPDGITKKYMVPLTKYILVQDNDFVKAGTALSDGDISPQHILSIKGTAEVQGYLVNNIQEVYRLQGVKINDKHFEVIVHQMMQKVQIIDSGDTRFLEGEAVNRHDFTQENDSIFDKIVVVDPGDSTDYKPGQIVSSRKLRDVNSQLKRKDMKPIEARQAVPATSKPILQGITRASLGTKSFISASSFQETTKVLSEASIAAKMDNLLGLKENVIVGHLVPSGTGVRKYDDLRVGSKEEYDLLTESKSE